ncbi:hypothetical protein, partial [Sandarakinorhabdus limnophila]|uniref:hypothetical protein n=1 Tax=Sandarakinorhabdus limnophila TaxID=210512 RepID=UPI0026EB0C97
ERKHLYFDLIGNLQGSIFEAERFLNHPLFDYGTPVTGSGEGLRWSYKLSGKDPVDPTRDPHLLIDHIMFTQRLVAKDTLPSIRGRAGLVERHPRTRERDAASKGRGDERSPAGVGFVDTGVEKRASGGQGLSPCPNFRFRAAHPQ